MTCEFLSIFHDFPGKFIFPGFSMTVGTLLMQQHTTKQ